ncbi:MAG TPA: CDP-diacylglycerol--glycerol-3-phosphate 3-phosphatidyltransferase [Rectinemataceae bacterium]
MTNADKVTLSRIFLAPVFFIAYRYAPKSSLLSVLFLWILFATIELSDLVDGRVARAEGKVSSFGKLFDPFADVLARITYFVCFAFDGAMPIWIFLIILYREFGMLFMRMLLGMKGVAMGARSGGKLKAGIYMVAGAISLALVSFERLGILSSLSVHLRRASLVAYIAAAILSVASFIDYLIQFRKLSA